MGLNQLYFLFGFLPVFLLVYYLIPNQFQNYILLIGSLVFYALGEPVCLIPLACSCLFTFVAGPLIQGDRRRFLGSIAINLVILGLGKYLSVLPFPVGLSVLTLKNIAYLSDIYEKKITPSDSLFAYMLYGFMFPTLPAGPILTWQEFRPQLYNRKISIEKLGMGAELLIKGLAKKALLADNLFLIYNRLRTAGIQASIATTLLGVIIFGFALYYDVSGYADMAVGLGKMTGFSYPSDYRYPLNAVSLRDFFGKWFVSLTGWCKEYIGRLSPAGAGYILLICSLMGLWHGISIPMLLLACYMILVLSGECYLYGRALERLPAVIRIIFTRILVFIGLQFFAMADTLHISSFVESLPQIRGIAFANMTTWYYFRSSIILLILAELFCHRRIYQLFKNIMEELPWLAVLINAVLLLLSVSYLLGNPTIPFIYATI